MSAGGAKISMIMEMRLKISTMMEICDKLYFGKGWCPLYYRETIVELVGKIQSEKLLRRIYKFVLYLYTRETGS